MTHKLQLGMLLATPGAIEAVDGKDVADALSRHAGGDWGEIPPDDVAENELALKEGYRIHSSYTSSTGIRFWIITEADRSVTTVLLPDEY